MGSGATYKGFLQRAAVVLLAVLTSPTLARKRTYCKESLVHIWLPARWQGGKAAVDTVADGAVSGVGVAGGAVAGGAVAGAEVASGVVADGAVVGDRVVLDAGALSFAQVETSTAGSEAWAADLEASGMIA